MIKEGYQASAAIKHKQLLAVPNYSFPIMGSGH